MTEHATAPRSHLVEAHDLVLVITTFGSAAVAENVAKTLVDEGLAACVNLLPGVGSVYRWAGALTQESEVMCFIKTQRDRRDALAARLAELHPYEVPEILVVPVQAASDAYRNWVLTSTDATSA